jgi:hypothetical protein
VYQFTRHAALDTTPLPEPAIEDRTGPPLTQGNLFITLLTVAGLDLSEASRAAVERMDPSAWYHGQVLETLLDELETKDPELPELIGRSLYFMYRAGLTQLGISSPTAVLQAVPGIWIHATRGDCGVWRLAESGTRRVVLEAEQPYNCRFEGGGLRGFIEAFDAYDVVTEHRTCMRRGDPFCTFDIRWKE